MMQKSMKSELRNQAESQSDGFADVAPARARLENIPAHTENSVDDKAIDISTTQQASAMKAKRMRAAHGTKAATGKSSSLPPWNRASKTSKTTES
jgi:hypothetical protein